MPLDFSNFKSRFESEPDPKKLRQILNEVKKLFSKLVQKIKRECNCENQNEKINAESVAKIILLIQQCLTNLETLGWPEAHQKMLDDFEGELFAVAGLSKP